jgi:XRE family aerobic/anaerobic benzoate catabolism transcriptional regulator
MTRPIVDIVRDDVTRDNESGKSVRTFIKAVGERVRHARQHKGLSRRAVSELSGVSQRYLAQLESGDGNISIALLYSVARALGHRVDWFVGDDDPLGSETAELVRLVRAANPEQRKQVKDILDEADAGSTRGRRICLIGVRGAGKSTLGARVGDALSIPFVELNSEIESQSGMLVDEVIALYGQEGFRRLERQALERMVSTTDEVIVAVAGGIVSEPEAYEFLLCNFYTIWLKASSEEHMNRVRAQGDHRPMAGNPAAMEELQSILRNREALYAKADRTVDTSKKSVEESLREVLGAIDEMGIRLNEIAWEPAGSTPASSHRNFPREL